MLLNPAANNKGHVLANPSADIPNLPEDDKNSRGYINQGRHGNTTFRFRRGHELYIRGKKRKKSAPSGTSTKKVQHMKRRKLLRNYFHPSKKLHLASYQPPGFQLNQQVGCSKRTQKKDVSILVKRVQTTTRCFGEESHQLLLFLRRSSISIGSFGLENKILLCC